MATSCGRVLRAASVDGEVLALLKGTPPESAQAGHAPPASFLAGLCGALATRLVSLGLDSKRHVIAH